MPVTDEELNRLSFAIERQESKINFLESENAKLKAEIKELKGQLEYRKEIIASHERALKERHEAIKLCFPNLKFKGEA